MSSWHLERAIFLLGHPGPLTRDNDGPAQALDTLVERTRLENEADPTAPYPPFELTDEERSLIVDADLARMYTGGVHPNLIRAFAGAWGIDYVKVYREAGLAGG